MLTDPDAPFVAQLRTELRLTTEPVTADPKVAARAFEGGRRRLRHRRAGASLGLVGAVAAAAIVIAVPSTWRPWLPGPVTQDPAAGAHGEDLYAALLARPVKGDLANDKAYAATAIHTWLAGFDRSASSWQLTGEPTVVWAAGTAAGPAAVVVQPAVVTRPTKEDGGPTTCIGFVGVDGHGGPRLVASDCWHHDYVAGASDGAWYVDPARRVLAVMDRGRPVGYNTHWDYGADGTRSMAFTPLPFHDGAAVLTLPDTTDADHLRLSDLPHTNWLDVVSIAGYTLPVTDGQCCGLPEPGLAWEGPGNQPTELHLAGTRASTLSSPITSFVQALDRRLGGIAYTNGGWFRWHASGLLPDGRNVVVGQEQIDLEPAHAYAVLVGPTGDQVVHGGVIDPKAALPIVIRLPGSTGWVVARKGATLSWRAGPTTAWTVAGPDAALVPPSAHEVLVQPSGGISQTVALTSPSQQ